MPFSESPFDSMGIKGTWHPATIIAVNDPDKASKVKVRVPALDDVLSDAEIPWAIPMNNFGPGIYAGLSVPPIGSSVFVYFPVDDSHYRYYAMANSLGASNALTALLKSYPNGRVSVDPIGVTTIVDYTAKTFTIGFPDGTGASWSMSDGSIHVKGKNVTVDGGSHLTLGAQTVDVLAGSTLNLSGGSINISGPVTQKGSSSGSPPNLPDMPHTTPAYPPTFTQRTPSQG